MGVPKLLIVLGCIYYSYASQHTHTIPVEGYETELQDLGEHVDHHETPVKVIKITKTIAVKVPVPYPVKVVQKVPYPVHIVKPYPVPVPHIVKIPQAAHAHPLPHEGADAGREDGGQQGHSYQVQEAPAHDAGHSLSYQPQQESFNGGAHGQNAEYAEEYPSNEGPAGAGGSYEAPSHSYYGSSGSPDAADADTFETKSYDQAIQAYLSKFQPSSSGSGHDFKGYH